MRIIECEQGTRAWFDARAGIPTASEFQTLLMKGKGGGDSKTRRTYMLKLAGERITGEVADTFTSHHMERGKVMEDEARAMYEFKRDMEARPVGFILDEVLNAGGSPDSLIGEEGLLEIKTKLPHLQLELLLAGGLPDEHKAQCQGLLMLSGRKWLDFVSYWPKLPIHIFRVGRDEDYIATLRTAVVEFNRQLDELVATIQTPAA